jgi:hypothetical protein
MFEDGKNIKDLKKLKIVFHVYHDRDMCGKSFIIKKDGNWS